MQLVPKSSSARREDSFKRPSLGQTQVVVRAGDDHFATTHHDRTAVLRGDRFEVRVHPCRHRLVGAGEVERFCEHVVDAGGTGFFNDAQSGSRDGAAGGLGLTSENLTREASERVVRNAPLYHKLFTYHEALACIGWEDAHARPPGFAVTACNHSDELS